MKFPYALLLALALLLMATSLFVLMQTGALPLFISVLTLFFFYALPFVIGEEAYDFLNKQVDGRLEPQRTVSVIWHLVFAALIGLCIGVIWMQVSVLTLNQGSLRVSEWLQFARQIDFTPTLGTYPRYAVEDGLLAWGTCFLGYVLEPLIQRLRRRHQDQQK